MTTISVSKRGTLTLPQSLRRALGIDKGGAVMAELEHGTVVLRPAVAFPIEIYSDDRVTEFDKADDELRKAMRARKGKKRAQCTPSSMPMSCSRRRTTEAPHPDCCGRDVGIRELAHKTPEHALMLARLANLSLCVSSAAKWKATDFAQ